MKPSSSLVALALVLTACSGDDGSNGSDGSNGQNAEQIAQNRDF